MTDKVVIFSDGGADPNPGIGGWAAIIQHGDREEVLTGSHPDTTNNRMELQAAISALRALRRPSQVEFHTDSQYVRLGISGAVDRWEADGWKNKAGKPTPNVDLWQELQSLSIRHDIEWHWVEGHAGHPMNERVDQLARQARLAITPQVEPWENVADLYLKASCLGNPGPGRWAAVLHAGDEWSSLSGEEAETTNNRMELVAAIEGIGQLPKGSSVQAHTTSDYVFQGVTRWLPGWQSRGWRTSGGQPVANQDLWRALAAVTEDRRIKWINAKGQRLEGLERAERLARNG